MKRLTQNFGFLAMGFLFPLAAFAEEGAAGGGHAWIAFPIGLGIAIAAGLAALGQGRIGAAFMEGVSRNPGAVKIMTTPLILSLIFVETLVLFTLLIEFMLLGKM
jgi:F-type H+-transporting ATPase subunit c